MDGGKHDPMRETIQDFIEALRIDVTNALAAFIPGLIAALVILVLGWLVARLLRLVIEQVLRRAGIDRLAERGGIGEALKEVNIQTNISHLVGQLAFWIIFLFFLQSATESLGLEAASEPLRALVLYLPRLLGAGVVLLAGMALSSLAAKAVEAAAIGAGLDVGRVLGRLAQLVVVALVLVIALDQLGFNSEVMSSLLSNALAAILAGGALAFALGGRDVAANILAAYYAKDLFELGEFVSVDGIEGTLESIGPVKATIATENGLVSIPNSALTTKSVHRHAQA
jgi:small-conductance mechanosensitive channel